MFEGSSVRIYKDITHTIPKPVERLTNPHRRYAFWKHVAETDLFYTMKPVDRGFVLRGYLSPAFTNREWSVTEYSVTQNMSQLVVTLDAYHVPLPVLDLEARIITNARAKRLENAIEILEYYIIEVSGL